jgi:hypothetical protein
VRKLEEACKKQEAVITEMEMQLSERNGRDGQKDASYQLLLAENRRLRDELKRHMEDSRRYYNEYADYLNRFWNPSAKELFEVKVNGSLAELGGGASTSHTRENYNLLPQYKSYRPPEDFLKETDYDSDVKLHSQTAREYSVRLPAITTRYSETSKTAR